MATKTPAKASKPAAKKAQKADPVVELTPVDDIKIEVGDSHAEINIKGRWDLDGCLALAKRLRHAAGRLS